MSSDVLLLLRLEMAEISSLRRAGGAVHGDDGLVAVSGSWSDPSSPSWIPPAPPGSP